jgi:hypothetical protein
MTIKSSSDGALLKPRTRQRSRGFLAGLLLSRKLNEQRVRRVDMRSLTVRILPSIAFGRGYPRPRPGPPWPGFAAAQHCETLKGRRTSRIVLLLA